MTRVLRWALVGAAALCLLALFAAFATMAFVFSIGTAMVTVSVDASVYDKETKAPVSNCLLAFEKNETSGYGQTSVRTDAQGRSSHETSHSYVGSMFWPFGRDRDPKLRFYVGEPSGSGTSPGVAAWDVRLHFREPWTSRSIVPRVEVQRTGAASPPAGDSRPLAEAVVHFESDDRGRQRYRIPMSIFLGQGEVAACQAEPPAEVERRANMLFNARKYEEALKEYREAARRMPETAWAHQGIGDCLRSLDRGKEAIASFRTAARLAPADPDIQFDYGNSLREGRYEEAVVQFRKVTAMEPDKARGFIGLGSSLYALDRCRDAVIAYGKAVELCKSCLDDGDRREYAECRRGIGK